MSSCDRPAAPGESLGKEEVKAESEHGKLRLSVVRQKGKLRSVALDEIVECRPNSMRPAVRRHLTRLCERLNWSFDMDLQTPHCILLSEVREQTDETSRPTVVGMAQTLLQAVAESPDA